MKITLSCELLEESPSHYRLKLDTGFGSPELVVAKDKVQVVEDKWAAVAQSRLDAERAQGKLL